MEESEWIGVHIHRSDILKTQFYFRQPVATAYLIDKQNGGYLEKSSSSDTGTNHVEPVSSKCFNVLEKRCASPNWDELIIVDEKMSTLRDNKHILIMFEITDNIPESKNGKYDRLRIAWGFLVPLASDGTFNFDKELRLQLFKPRKSCKISHHTCNLFHLYSNHKRKKLPGSLYITIKGVQRTKNGAYETEPKIVPSVAEEKPTTIETKNEIQNLNVIKWSRLPTQSCKIPNKIDRIYNIGRNGGSYVQFSKTGMYIAIASLSKIPVHNVITGDEVIELHGHNGLIYELDWSNDDQFLLSVSSDCTSAVWNLTSKTPLFILPHPSFVYCGKWFGSSDGLITGGKDHMIRYWFKTGDSFELKDEIGGHLGFVSALVVQDDAILFSGDSTGCLMIRKQCDDYWILIKRLMFDELSQKVIDCIYVHPGRRRVLLTLRGRGSYMIDVAAGVILQSYKAMVNMCARSISCLTPCGSLIFSFCQNGDMDVKEINTGKLLATYENLFPVERLSELSSCIHYHPFEHMMAFTILGHNHPVYLLKYEQTNDDSKKLGLTFKHQEVNKNIAVLKNYVKNEQPLISLKNKQDRLMSIVQEMNQIFTVKNYNVGNDWSL